jgi:hypothetical protein
MRFVLFLLTSEPKGADWVVEALQVLPSRSFPAAALRLCRLVQAMGAVEGPSVGNVGVVARLSPGQRTVEDQAVAFVVVDHCTTFVCVVVRAFRDATATGFNSLRRGVDISGLDTDDDLPGYGMVHRGRQCDSDRPTIEGCEVGSVAELQGHPQGLTVKPDRFIQVVGRQDDHAYFVLTQWCLLWLSRFQIRPGVY